MLFNDRENGVEDIYRKLMSDSLDANLGYLYENAIAQSIKADGRELYYHTWKKEGSTHSFEIDFLLTVRNKLVPIEVKSASVISHKSLVAFNEKYFKKILYSYIFSRKDVDIKEGIRYKPFYMFNSFLKNLK